MNRQFALHQHVAVCAGLLAALGGAAGCGGGLVTPPMHQGPPLAVLRAEVTGALTETPAAPVMGALVWHAYSAALLDCLAPIAVDHPLDFYNPSDEAAIGALSTCAALHLDAEVASNTVHLDPVFPANFDIPLTALPDPAILSGDAAARMGIALVHIFADGDNDGAFTLAPPGTQVSDDVVLGSSRYVGDENADVMRESYVVYREGALSPFWKIFVGIYGCTDEPHSGFSVVHLTLDNRNGTSTCTVNDAPIAVVLDDSRAMQQLVCAPQPAAEQMTPPGDGLPGGVAIACDGTTLMYASDPEALCPAIGRRDLYGCTDTSSEESCNATFFDETASPPTWWPCGGSYVRLSGNAGPATSGLDEIAVLWASSSTVMELKDDIEVRVQVNEAGDTLALSGAALRLVDNDGNGWFNAGDEIRARELMNVFDETSEPGYYALSLWIRGQERPEAASFYSPVPIDQTVGQLELAISDAPGETGAAGDLLFTLTCLSGDATYAPADLKVVITDGCEIPNDVLAEALTVIDNDGDARFGAGDALEVRAPMEGFSPIIGGPSCISLQVKTGVNLFTYISGTFLEWTQLAFILEDDAASLTSDLDTLFDVTFTGVSSPCAAEQLEVYVTVYDASFNTRTYNPTLGSGLVYVDADESGSVSAGDRLTIVETAPFLSEADSGDDVNVWVSAPFGSAHGYTQLE